MNIASSKPEQVVQKQLEAYNARDIEALLGIYADDAQMFEHPSKLPASGSAEVRERFAVRFKEPDLHSLAAAVSISYRSEIIVKC